MMFIELFVPKGALNEEQRQRLSERLITEFITVDEEKEAPVEVLEANRQLQQVVVHEPDTWIVGGKAVEPGEAPRYLVRVSVPSSWRKEMSAEVIARVTRVLADADANPQRLYHEPVAWVQVIGVPEGSYGAFGKVMLSNDIVKLITEPFRQSTEREAIIAAAAPGTAVDPVCGMTVPLKDGAITLELDGTTYAFCSVGCRQVFLEEHHHAAHE